MTQHLEEVSKVITQEDINIYAELSNDFNPLHVDREFAATTVMGDTIAHGTLSVNLIWQSLARTFGADALANIQLDIRFLKPVFADSTITAGGQRVPDDPQRFEVWVNDANGTTVIAGHVLLTNTTLASLQ